MPTLVDELDNKVETAYDAHPERLFVVDKSGKIVFRTDPGPRGFKPKTLDAFLERFLEKPENRKGATKEENQK